MTYSFSNSHSDHMSLGREPQMVHGFSEDLSINTGNVDQHGYEVGELVIT